ncbi:MAG: glycosyltransferase family 4 protein, partial [Caldilineaceae bacterium]|nr:glycosyltransferase family 4 protein [Caldilineaceae bacterium]
MKIAIEALGIHYFGGGRSATLNLLEALFALDTKNEYTVFLSQPEPTLETAAGNVTQVVAPFQNRFALRLWAQARLPFLTRGYDLVHFIKNLTVPFIPTRTAVTMYDMATVLHPDLYPTFDVWYWRYVQPTLLRNTDKVIAISHDAANDVARFYGIPRAEVAVIYPSYATHFGPVAEMEVERVRQQYGLPEQYLLHVGRLDRRKNLPALVRAFADFLGNPAWATMADGRPFTGKLVFVGEEYRKSRDETLLVLIAELGLQDRICFTGPIPDQDIAALYAGALVAISVSRHEGFG